MNTERHTSLGFFAKVQKGRLLTKLFLVYTVGEIMLACPLTISGGAFA